MVADVGGQRLLQRDPPARAFAQIDQLADLVVVDRDQPGPLAGQQLARRDAGGPVLTTVPGHRPELREQPVRRRARAQLGSRHGPQVGVGWNRCQQFGDFGGVRAEQPRRDRDRQPDVERRQRHDVVRGEPVAVAVLLFRRTDLLEPAARVAGVRRTFLVERPEVVDSLWIRDDPQQSGGQAGVDGELHDPPAMNGRGAFRLPPALPLGLSRGSGRSLHRVSGGAGNCRWWVIG
jgi:hypothetical protein